MGSTNVQKEPLYPLIEFPENLDVNDHYCRLRLDMVTIHNCMIRGLNSIYNQAFIPKTDAERKSFAGYSLCLTEGTKHHHRGEELFFFSEAEKRIPGSMQVNVEQHHAFHDGFEAMETYFTKVQKDPSVHDGQKIRNMIEEFGAVFQKHLEDEIATLEKSKLKAIFPDVADMKKISDDLRQYAIKHGSKLTSFPWMISHHEESSCHGFFDDIPSWVPFCARYVFSLFNYSYWQWSPCTLHSVMKPTANVGTLQKEFFYTH